MQLVMHQLVLNARTPRTTTPTGARALCIPNFWPVQQLFHQHISITLQCINRFATAAFWLPCSETAFPQRLRPKDSSGSPLRGPFVSRNSGKPWNVGRQYFSSFKNGDFSGFMWADGVGAMEAEAQASFNQTMGGMFGMF